MRLPATRLGLLSLILTFDMIVAAPAFAASPQPVKAEHGMVVTAQHLATDAGVAVLKSGGNAIDAAVAVGYTLAVVYPTAGNIGGGGFMMIYLAKDKRVITIDHRETAPAAFTPTVFQANGKEMAFDPVVASGLSVGVPGTVRGWDEALTRYGTMAFKQVLAPAIRLAGQGFTADKKFNEFVVDNTAKFRLFSSTSALYLKGGKAPEPGAMFRNPDLAKAYRALASGGARAFYSGKMAQAIVDASAHPPMSKGNSVVGGKITLADLANYEARIRLPVHSTYRGYDLYGMALPSSGGIAVAEALNILEGYDLKSMPPDKVEHLYLEASRLAFADRNAYLADPEYVDAPVPGLLSKEFANRRREQISLSRAAGPAAAGDPYLFQHDPSTPQRPSANRLLAESAHTTHLTVSDKDGNIVSYTYTIESWGGSGIVVPGYGFILNNEMTDFDFSGPRPNVPEAGKRPRSSMAPTLAFRNGKPAFSIGSPGGATIITTVLQTIVNYVDLGMPMEQAIAAPRLSERNGDNIDVEPGFPGSAQAQALEQYGHQWSTAAEEIGAANALVFNPDGSVSAVSESARHGIGSALVQKSAH